MDWEWVLFYVQIWLTFLVGCPWKSNEVLEKSLTNGCNFLYERWRGFNGSIQPQDFRPRRLVEIHFFAGFANVFILTVTLPSLKHCTQMIWWTWLLTSATITIHPWIPCICVFHQKTDSETELHLAVEASFK